MLLKPSSDSTASRKRARSSSSEASNAQKRSYGAHQSDKVAKTNEILFKVEEKHESKYSSEHLRTWANLILLKKHSSLDTPPDYLFLGGIRSVCKTKPILGQLSIQYRQEQVTLVLPLEHLLEAARHEISVP